MPQGILERGASSILNAGAWNNSPNPVTQNLSLSDVLNISESFNTILTPSTVKSILNRGATTILDVGAFRTMIDPVTQNLSLSDVLNISESLSLIKSKGRAKSILERGATTTLDIGAVQWIADHNYIRLVNFSRRRTFIGR